LDEALEVYLADESKNPLNLWALHGIAEIYKRKNDEKANGINMRMDIL
jgi:hypothetical protein